MLESADQFSEEFLSELRDKLPDHLPEPRYLTPEVRSSVSNTFKVYSCTFDKEQRSECRLVLNANKEAVKFHLWAQEHKANSSYLTHEELGFEGIEAGTRTVSLQKLKANTNIKIDERAHAVLLPRGAVLPKCTSWTTSLKCTKWRGKKKRMFYTDEEGETVPQSDEEWEEQYSVNRIFGRNRRLHEGVLHALLPHYKFNTQAMLALAKELEWKWEWLVHYVSETPTLFQQFVDSRLQRFVASLDSANDGSADMDTGEANMATELQNGAGSSDEQGDTSEASCSDEGASRADNRTLEYKGSAPEALTMMLAARAMPTKLRTIDLSANRLTGQPPSNGYHSGSTEDAHVEAPFVAVMNQTNQSYCQFCKTFNCSLHGVNQVMHEAYPEQIGHDDLDQAELVLGPCGDDCHRSKDWRRLPAAAWTESEQQLLATGQSLFHEDPCRLALMVDSKTCVQVQQRLKHAEHQLYLDTAGGSLASAPRRRHTSGAGTSLLSNKRAPAIASRLKHDSSSLWPEFKPCNCDPEVGCTASCSCAHSKNFCEKYCRCGANCGNIHPGCNCSLICETVSCPCLASGRECDPDKCKGCAPTARVQNMLGSELQENERVCKNMNLRLRVRRPVSMGLSLVSGWGCFVMEDLEKGDFIGEYTGVQVSQEEAERRGTVYDIMDCSYLFSVNEQWAIDAGKSGNKLRYANHSDKKNAYARVLLVDGDHRVGIFADTPMAAGTEIFYNYGYTDCHCPEWGEQDVGNSGRRKSQPARQRPGLTHSS